MPRLFLSSILLAALFPNTIHGMIGQRERGNTDPSAPGEGDDLFLNLLQAFSAAPSTPRGERERGAGTTDLLGRQHDNSDPSYPGTGRGVSSPSTGDGLLPRFRHGHDEQQEASYPGSQHHSQHQYPIRLLGEKLHAHHDLALVKKSAGPDGTDPTNSQLLPSYSGGSSSSSSPSTALALQHAQHALGKVLAFYVQSPLASVCTMVGGYLVKEKACTLLRNTISSVLWNTVTLGLAGGGGGKGIGVGGGSASGVAVVPSSWRNSMPSTFTFAVALGFSMRYVDWRLFREDLCKWSIVGFRGIEDLLTDKDEKGDKMSEKKGRKNRFLENGGRGGQGGGSENGDDLVNQQRQGQGGREVSPQEERDMMLNYLTRPRDREVSAVAGAVPGIETVGRQVSPGRDVINTGVVGRNEGDNINIRHNNHVEMQEQEQI